MIEIKLEWRRTAGFTALLAACTAVVFYAGWIDPTIFATSKNWLLRTPAALMMIRYIVLPLLVLLTGLCFSTIFDGFVFSADETGFTRNYPLGGRVSFRWDDIETVFLRVPDSGLRAIVFRLKKGREKTVLFHLVTVREVDLPVKFNGIDVNDFFARPQKIQNAQKLFEKPA